MPSNVAVLFIHGVEVRDPDYANAAIARLRRHFARHTAGTPGADVALVIEPAYWVPAVADQEDKILTSTFDTGSLPFYRLLGKLVTRIDAGSLAALVPVLLSGLFRRIPGVNNMDYPTLRWAMTYFVGDAIAYQVTPSDRRVYDAIHHRISTALHSLAKRAGPDAPLCIIAHSLGTVIASDHIWDQQRENAERPAAGRTTPLERCETLAYLYTLGCPIPIWTLRYPDFGEPITFPPPELAQRWPGIDAKWVNYHDRDDIVAYPLRGLSPAYGRMVEDQMVSVGPPLIGNTPLSHLMYWNDDAVMEPIAAALADMWRGLESSAAGRTKRSRSRGARRAGASASVKEVV